jgi:hypothetical protein
MELIDDPIYTAYKIKVLYLLNREKAILRKNCIIHELLQSH